MQLSYKNAPAPKFREEVRRTGIKQVQALNLFSKTSVYEPPSYITAFRMSLQQAMSQSGRRDAILAAMKYNEIENLEAPDILTCIKYHRNT